jgi:hypothetical protein
MRNYCTLFDSNYLPRALVMYHSLVATGEIFTLYVVCFDDLALDLLNKLNHPNIIAISLKDIESDELLEVKPSRAPGEYCWTCTPHVIRYVLDNYRLSQVTYLDADLCFYHKPSILLDEFEQANASVLITEHRYTPIYDRSKVAGIYCVQFVTFNADERGLKVLEWWQSRCLEWCYARFEDGKFGDQKYLDDWTTRFEGVHVLQHLGGGVAPWNVQQYELSNQHGQLYVNKFALVFYHFHGYKYYESGLHNLIVGYKLDDKVIAMLYQDYAKAILTVYQEIYSVDSTFSRGWSVRDLSWKLRLMHIKFWLLGTLNEYRIV